jgi:CxxC motif-containing protein
VQKRNMTCIVCPVGCRMEVEVDDDDRVTGVKNNACARGKKYADTEITNPQRTLTSTVRIDGAAESFLPVRTAEPISKGRLSDAMAVIRALRVSAPVSMGDALANFDGVDIIACKTTDTRTQ